VKGHRAGLVLFAVACAVLVVLLVPTVASLPDFGQTPHPYGERAVAAAQRQQTANVVASVTFDQRALDTLAEEFMLFAAAVGTVLLLRRLASEDEAGDQTHDYGPEDVFEAVRLVGYLMLPLTLLIGAYVVLHGHISPGGGFQGGVVLATGLHLAYLAGDLPALDRMRSRSAFEVSEAAGAGAFVVVGLVALATGSTFLGNVLPHGAFGSLLSAGTIPLLNAAVGVEVGSALVLMLTRFLEQALLIRRHKEEG
jgi:multicomponent Na+:H+ antiporter subunit B